MNGMKEEEENGNTAGSAAAVPSCLSGQLLAPSCCRCDRIYLWMTGLINCVNEREREEEKGGAMKAV